MKYTENQLQTLTKLYNEEKISNKELREKLGQTSTKSQNPSKKSKKKRSKGKKNPQKIEESYIDVKEESKSSSSSSSSSEN